MGKGIKKAALKKNINNMNQSMKNLAENFKKLSTNLNLMMKGDADGPYWNGTKAQKFYSKATKNLVNDLADYGSALDILNTIAVHYEQSVSGDKSK